MPPNPHNRLMRHMSSWVRPFHFSFTIWEDCGQQIGITVRPEGILDKLIFGQASHCALKCKWGSGHDHPRRVSCYGLLPSTDYCLSRSTRPTSSLSELCVHRCTKIIYQMTSDCFSFSYLVPSEAASNKYHVQKSIW